MAERISWGICWAMGRGRVEVALTRGGNAFGRFETDIGGASARCRRDVDWMKEGWGEREREQGNGRSKQAFSEVRGLTPQLRPRGPRSLAAPDRLPFPRSLPLLRKVFRLSRSALLYRGAEVPLDRRVRAPPKCFPAPRCSRGWRMGGVLARGFRSSDERNDREGEDHPRYEQPGPSRGKAVNANGMFIPTLRQRSVRQRAAKKKPRLRIK